MDFVEICNVYVGKMIIKAAKRIFNSDKICRSYSDLNFGVTFFGTQCILCTLNSRQRHIVYSAIRFMATFAEIPKITATSLPMRAISAVAKLLIVYLYRVIFIYVFNFYVTTSMN